MRDIKIIQLKITVTNQKALYGKNINQSLLNLFNDTWGGKCFQGTYIIEGLEILRRSGCIVDKNSLDANVTVSVEIRCSVVVYNQYDVIVGEVINVSSNGDLILKNNHAAIYVTIPIVAKEGDLLPLYVIDCQYPLNKDKVSVNGEPFVRREHYIYKLIEGSYGLDELDLTPVHKLNQDMGEIAVLFGATKRSKVGHNLDNLSIGSCVRHSASMFAKYDVEIIDSKKYSQMAISVTLDQLKERIASEYISEVWTCIMMSEYYDVESIKKSKWFKIYSSHN